VHRAARQRSLSGNAYPSRLPAGPDSIANVRLVDDARKRAGSRLYGRDQLTTVTSGLAFLAAALALRALFADGPALSAGLAALLVAVYAALSRVEFELASGTVLPTELVLVPMLFLAPSTQVPLLAALGFIAGGLPDMLRGRLHAERVFVRLTYSWHTIGPATVFAVAKPGPPEWRDWPIYALALVAQFAFDLISSTAREWLGVGVRPRVLAPALFRTYLVDLLLAPIGFLAALAAADHPLAVVTVLPLALLLALIATDRRERIEETIELNDAFETVSTVARADALTGLANRRGWEEHVEALESGRVGAGLPASAIVLDLDGLKRANDSRGHAFGDLLIREAARLIEECVGADAFVARTGGDEFAVALPLDAAGCATATASLEAAVRAHRGLDGFPLSFSVGAGSVPPATSFAEALAVADRQMYEVKRRSRRARSLPS